MSKYIQWVVYSLSEYIHRVSIFTFKNRVESAPRRFVKPTLLSSSQHHSNSDLTR